MIRDRFFQPRTACQAALALFSYKTVPQIISDVA
jgi:hypothetical protein